MNVEANSEELLAFDPTLNSVEIRITQTTSLPTNENVKLSVRTTLHNDGKLVGNGEITYQFKSGVLTSSHIILSKGEAGKPRAGWCWDTNKVLSYGLASSITLTFSQWPYARVISDKTTRNAKFFQGQCYYALNWSLWNSLMKKAGINGVRVTTSGSTSNLEQYLRVEYRIFNCEYNCVTLNISHRI